MVAAAVSKHAILLPDCSGHGVVGIFVLMETIRRVGNPIPRPLKDDAFNQAGYCLDAPEVLPGGGCYVDRFGDEPDDWVTQQFLVYR